MLIGLSKISEYIFIKTGSIAYVDKNDFENLYSIYTIDLSDLPHDISHVKSNTSLNVDFNNDITAGR